MMSTYTTQIILEVLGALFLIDFVTAFMHWFEDNYLYYDFPFPILNGLSIDNEMHHFMPRTITYYSYLENMYYTTILALILVIIILSIRHIFNIPLLKNKYFLGTTLIFGMLPNLIHRFQHERDCERPYIISQLFKYGIFIDREKHKMHHKMPNGNYGVMVPILNNIYEYFNLWNILERFIFFFFDIPTTKKKSNYIMRDTFDEECPRKINSEDMKQYYIRLKYLRDINYI